MGTRYTGCIGGTGGIGDPERIKGTGGAGGTKAAGSTGGIGYRDGVPLSHHAH